MSLAVLVLAAVSIAAHSASVATFSPPACETLCKAANVRQDGDPQDQCPCIDWDESVVPGSHQGACSCDGATCKKDNKCLGDITYTFKVNDDCNGGAVFTKTTLGGAWTTTLVYSRGVGDCGQADPGPE